MLLGPVFRVELLNTSKRRRTYAARAIYGLILLGIVGLFYREWQLDMGGGRASPAMLAFAAEAVFRGFVIAQVLGVWLLTPAMVAPTIAGDRQRMILDDLLTSGLSSVEIVVGKLAARMLALVMIIMVGLPILSLLTLFGGVDPLFVLAAFGGTITASFALASFSIFVSAVSRRGRDAVIAVYLATLAGFFIPRNFRAFLAHSTPIPPTWLDSFETPFELLDPFRLARIGTPFTDLLRDVGAMAAAQVVVGLIFIALAVWRLRPAFANGDRRRNRPARRVVGRRKAVGDDPMLWKERETARMGRVLRTLGVVGGGTALLVIGMTLRAPLGDAFDELGRFGYGDASIGVIHTARNVLGNGLAGASAIAFLTWTLGLAATAAVGITSEREGDTWIGLLATPLTGREILRAKALGAIWRWRWAGGLALVLWTLGLVAGAIHPLGYALTLAGFVAFTAATLALGLFISMKVNSSIKAIALTIAVLFGVNFGPIFFGTTFRYGSGLDMHCLSPLYVIATAPAAYSTVQTLFGTYPADNHLHLSYLISVARTCTIVVVGTGVFAACLAAWSVDEFERVAGRPQRPPGYRPTEEIP